MASSGFGAAAPARVVGSAARHPALVRATHWITAAAFVALLVTGAEIVVSHPRFYWGETGNVLMPPLFSIPIPASRATVPTGYGYVLPDQNGWSRSLHFEAAWAVVLAGLAYGAYGFATGHFRRALWPARADVSRAALARAIADHVRFRRPAPEDARRYNVLQRAAYLAVVFALFPLAIWTGLGMSPAVVSAFPFFATALGGQQSARTVHFFVSIALAAFLAVHVGMVVLAGFRQRMRGMITGRVED